MGWGRVAGQREGRVRTERFTRFVFYNMFESRMDNIIEQVEAIGRQQEITTIAVSAWTSEAYLMVIVTSVFVLSALNLMEA